MSMQVNDSLSELKFRRDLNNSLSSVSKLPPMARSKIIQRIEEIGLRATESYGNLGIKGGQEARERLRIKKLQEIETEEHQLSRLLELTAINNPL